MGKPQADSKSLKTMGTYLKASRIELKLTQEQVAEHVGISVTYLRKIEKGSSSASWHLWLQIIYYLKLDLEVIKFILPELKE